MNVKLIVGILIFAAGGILNHAHGQLRTWTNPSNGDWTDGGNWSPFGIPGVADTARLGFAAGTNGVNVTLESDQSVNTLWMVAGTRLNINSGRLDANNVLLSGSDGNIPTTLRIQSIADLALSADNVTIQNGAVFRIANGGHVQIDESLNIQAGGVFEGRGELEFLDNSGIALNNNGDLHSDAGFGGLVLNQGGDALLDLDGSTGNGTIVVTGGNSFFGQDQLIVNGTELADSFSGTLEMATASIVNMNLSNGWVADAGSEINFQSQTSNSNGFARIQGGDVTFAGDFNLLGNGEGYDDQFIVEADANIASTSVFNVEEDNQLVFQGLTLVNGGTFSTHDNLPANGAVRFAGPTTWDGIVVVQGVARQQGNATVIGSTTINADRFDPHQGDGSVSWNINHSLTLNANQIGESPNNLTTATFNVNNGLFSRLTVNLDEANESWTLGGELNLFNNLPFTSTRIAGSKMNVAGRLSVQSANVRIIADTEFQSGSDIHFASNAASLILAGQSWIQEGSAFAGDGTLINDTGAELLLGDGASLGEVELINRGLLQIGDSPGLADVARFEAAADSHWNVEIGGYVSGDEYDVLLVSDAEAILGGEISVDLIDIGLQEFAPNVGDEFKVLISLGGVIGEFDNQPVSSLDDQTYFWDVVYNSHDVTLKLASITSIPEPTFVPICLAIAGLTACRTRRRKRPSSCSPTHVL